MGVEKALFAMAAAMVMAMVIAPVMAPAMIMAPVVVVTAVTVVTSHPWPMNVGYSKTGGAHQVAIRLLNCWFYTCIEQRWWILTNDGHPEDGACWLADVHTSTQVRRREEQSSAW